MSTDQEQACSNVQLTVTPHGIKIRVHSCSNSPPAIVVEMKVSEIVAKIYVVILVNIILHF